MMTDQDKTPTPGSKEYDKFEAVREKIARLHAAKEAAEVSITQGKLAAFKGYVWQYFSAAFCDAKKGKTTVSLGRLAFVAWYTQAIYKWQAMPVDVDIQPSMLYVGLALLAYITGTKTITAVQDWRKR